MHLIDEVAGSATTNVIDGSSVLAEALLLGQFLVEAEHGALLLAVNVAGAATARGKEGVGGRRREREERSRSGRIGTSSGRLGVHTGDITGAAPTGVVDVGGRDGGVWLGDLVGWHCGCWSSVCEMD